MVRQLYSRLLLPRLVQMACSSRAVTRQRTTWVPRARGRVLDIGFGAGLNLPPYQRVLILGAGSGNDVFASLQAGAESIPMESGTVDTVVVTYSLCSIELPEVALSEIRRVLKSGGRLVFCEHGASPDHPVRRWQDRITPVWRRIAGGCHLNRDVPGLIRQAGFRLHEIEAGYLPGWKPAAWNTAGCARKR